MTSPGSGLPTGDTTTTASTVASIPVANAAGYIQLPVTVDPAQLSADAFAFIAEQIPGWEPHEGQLEAWLIEACARMVTVSAQVASQVPVQIFEYFGGLLGAPPNLGTAAQVTTTWTMVDAQGYTVPAGTLVAYQATGNTLVLFTTTAAFTVPAGSTSTAGGAVTLTAQTAGAAGNGLPAGPMILVDSLSYVTSVISTAPTAGGADPETTGAYLNRLSQRLQLLTPRPVLAADFAVMAAQVAGVGRAVGIDNYSPYANALTVVDASFETGAGTWQAVTNCGVTTSTAWAADGTHSLLLTSTASESMTAQSGWYPVSPGLAYSGSVLAHAATTAAPCALDLVWADIHFNVLSTTTGAAVNDSTAGGVQVTVSDEAPSTAAYVRLQAAVTAGAAGQAHALDEAGLYLGSVPATWGAGGVQYSQERCCTVVPVDGDGDALDASQMTAVRQYLQGLRETNFDVIVVPPTYTAVTVIAQVATEPSSDPDTVESTVQANLEAYLSPGTWAGGSSTPPVWLADTTVYYLSVASVVDNTPGVHHIVSLTVNGGTGDVALAGAAPLPTPTVSVTSVPAAAGT